MLTPTTSCLQGAGPHLSQPPVDYREQALAYPNHQLSTGSRPSLIPTTSCLQGAGPHLSQPPVDYREQALAYPNHQLSTGSMPLLTPTTSRLQGACPHLPQPRILRHVTDCKAKTSSTIIKKREVWKRSQEGQEGYILSSNLDLPYTNIVKTYEQEMNYDQTHETKTRNLAVKSVLSAVIFCSLNTEP